VRQLKFPRIDDVMSAFVMFQSNKMNVCGLDRTDGVMTTNDENERGVMNERVSVQSSLGVGS
jgi:hypothetical protein